MNAILGWVSLSLSALIVLVLSHLAFGWWRYVKGVEQGTDQGYIKGRKDADNWWLGVESEADQARVKIWREEAHL